MENIYKARWEDKRDERVSGEMKGGNTEPDDWMNSIQRERESLLHIPMSEFFCCRPLDCLYSIKILLLLTCTGVGGEIDEQSSLLQMTCHERTPRETLLVTPHYIPSWTVKSYRVRFCFRRDRTCSSIFLCEPVLLLTKRKQHRRRKYFYLNENIITIII